MEYRMAEEKDTLRLSEMRWDFKYGESEADPGLKEDFIIEFSDFLRKGLPAGWYCWVAADNGTIISNMFIKRIEKLPELDGAISYLGYVTNVYTVPAYRNKGIGAKLMERAKEWCAGQGFELLIVWPSDESIPFYERAGFKGENEILELLFDDE